MLVEGTADVERGGKKIAKLGPGDFFGEIALIAKTPRNATIKTTSPVRALVITDRAFRQLLDHSPKIQIGVLTALAERLAPTSPVAARLHFRDGCGRAQNRDPRSGPDRRGADLRSALRGLANGGRALGLDAARRARDRAARAARRARHALERRGRGRRGARRDRRQAAGHRDAARRDRAADPARADRPLDRSGDPDRRDRASPRRRCSGRARNAEHARRRPRGHGWDLRGLARRRGEHGARRGGTPPCRRRRPGRGAVHGRGHRRVRLGAGLLRPAGGGDDRGGHPARPLARGLDAARRPDDARDGEAAART